MYVYYEIINENPSDPDSELYEFVLSSDGRSNAIWFYDKAEKAKHNTITQLFKQIPLEVREYNASTYITQVIGIAGKRLLAILEQFKITGFLSNVTITKIDFLTIRVESQRLNWYSTSDQYKPKLTPKPRDIDIKFNEEDFFYKQPTNSGELCGEVLQIALAKILEIEVPRLKILAESDLKRIYRQRALALHPDRNQGNGDRMSELNYLYRLFTAN